MTVRLRSGTTISGSSCAEIRLGLVTCGGFVPKRVFRRWFFASVGGCRRKGV
ncbi:hypothetical protein BIFADO_00971 [Bifidobacterium adolescentis L2-32]|uniref:Uncharacterized protein n=1 Tax=Bifidobacterium adolescentis L2-32 TaxID=411481 RepID=A7A556_BIFAD|nr:hypothetical protein BIFADO_00971 [Bifidobacterium adolescentis L2-32]